MPCVRKAFEELLFVVCIRSSIAMKRLRRDIHSTLGEPNEQAFAPSADCLAGGAVRRVGLWFVLDRRHLHQFFNFGKLAERCSSGRVRTRGCVIGSDQRRFGIRSLICSGSRRR